MNHLFEDRTIVSVCDGETQARLAGRDGRGTDGLDVVAFFAERMGGGESFVVIAEDDGDDLCITFDREAQGAKIRAEKVSIFERDFSAIGLIADDVDGFEVGCDDAGR
jgi:hypothetical protein